MMFPSSAITTCLLLTALMNLATACTDTVYIGTLDGQVAISKDGGNAWSTVLKIGGWCVRTVSAQGDHIYAGTDYGLFVSHDGGAMWSLKDLQTASGCDSRVISIFADDDKHVYALIGYSKGCGRVAVTSDNGDTWPTNFQLPDSIAFNPGNIYVDGPRIYVASQTGLGYTDDMGTTWTIKNQASGLGSDYVCSVIGKGQTIYAGLFPNGAPVSASWDGGRTWKTVNTTPTSISDYAISMYLHNGTLYVAAANGGGLSWSNDFNNWTRKTTVDGLASDSTRAIIGSGDNLYLGTYGGLSLSRDKGQTWITKTMNDGLPSNWVYTVFVQCG